MKVRKYFRVGYQENVTRGNPRGLVVAELQPEGNIAVGFSLCHENDSFDKDKSNMIAECRLRSNYFVVNSPEDVEKVVKPIFKPLFDDLRWCVQEVRTRQNKKNGVQATS